MRNLTLLALALSPLALAACGDKDDDTGDAVVDTDAMAADLWADIDGYDNWNQLEEWTGVNESGNAHGAYVQIWYNSAAYSAIQGGGGGDLPDGSIIVKEGYDDAEGATLGAITVMMKDSTYGDTGWFWAQYTDTSGTIGLSGEPSGCTGCHEAGQDYNLAASW